jgi:hypothetical protein
MMRLLMALALVAGLTVTPLHAAKEPDSSGEMIVRDEAGLFTPEAIAKAKESFQSTTFHGHVKFAVHTFKVVPEAKKAEFEAASKDGPARRAFFEAWADELGRSDGGNPVVALIYREEKKFFTAVASDRATARDNGRKFSDKKADHVKSVFNTALDAVLKGANLHTKLDGALQDATTLVIEDLRNTSAPGANHSTKASHTETGSKGNIMSYICIGVCVLAGVWLVIGLIRAFTGGGGGGGMGGGGGGGFMSSMMGGLFGSMAGMWMYNNFFGGGMGSLGATDSMTGDAGTTDTGAGDYDGGASAADGGGDWGDSGGGDVGGGGDWGDSGGGGDFGGGDW